MIIMFNFKCFCFDLSFFHFSSIKINLKIIRDYLFGRESIVFVGPTYAETS